LPRQIKQIGAPICGIYLEMVEDGLVAVGDELVVLRRG
jgi:hypothetical protein